MELNTKKCKFLHFAHVNSAQVQSYYMEELDHFGQLKKVYLDQSDSERDLGVKITTSLKQHQQVSIAAARANWVLGSLKRSFTSRDASLSKKKNIHHICATTSRIWHSGLESTPGWRYKLTRTGTTKSNSHTSCAKGSELRK